MFVRGWNETTDLDYSDEATRTVTSSRTLIKARPHMWDGRNSFLQLVVAILGSGIYCCICLINRTLTCLSASLFFQYFSDSSPAENLGRGAEIEQSTTIQILWGPSCCAKLTSPHQTYSPFLGFNLAPNTKQLQVLRMPWKLQRDHVGDRQLICHWPKMTNGRRKNGDKGELIGSGHTILCANPFGRRKTVQKRVEA